MGITAIVFASLVLTTADFCANPIEGGVGEPQFCRLNDPQPIETPVFSIIVDSTFLIGIDRGGRYSEGKLDGSSKTLGGTTWDWCREYREEHDSTQFYFLRTSQYLVLISHYSSKLGEDLTPAVHRVLETVAVHGI
jgi:hypothetical protein